MACGQQEGMGLKRVCFAVLIVCGCLLYRLSVSFMFGALSARALEICGIRCNLSSSGRVLFVSCVATLLHPTASCRSIFWHLSVDNVHLCVERTRLGQLCKGVQQWIVS